MSVTVLYDCRWILPIALASLTLGCQDHRLAEQLQEADKRAELTAAQIETANAQLALLNKSLTLAEKNLEQANQRAAIHIEEFENKAAMQKQQLQEKNETLQKKLESTLRELADAKSHLEELERQKASAAKQRSALGVWEVRIDDDNQYRFAIYEDGVVVVRQKTPPNFVGRVATTWSPPHLVNISPPGNNGHTRFPCDTYTITRLSSDTFSISGTLHNVPHKGELLVNADGTANIRLNALQPDEYGRWKWYKAIKTEDPDTPDR